MSNITSPAALSIVTALGGNAATGMCRCVAHDDRNPSLQISNDEFGNVRALCFAGCTKEAVVGKLRAMGLWPARGQMPAQSAKPIADRDSDEQEHKAPSWFYLLRAAAGARPGKGAMPCYLKPDRPTAYLAARGLKTVPENLMMLPANLAAELTGKNFPTMAAPITNAGGTLQGIQTLWLTRDGNAKLSTDAPRRIYGVARDGFVQFGELDPNQALVIGEGIETTMSAREITGLPAIAALSAGNMRTLRLPECREVVIAADHDKPGLEAAKALATRLARDGKVVRIAVPTREGDDWNDVIQSDHDRKHLRNLILEAPVVKAPDASELALSVADFMTISFPDQKYLLKPWLTTSGIHMLFGSPGVGKSYLALAIAFAVAQRKPLMNWDCEHQARVLYIDGELAGKTLQKRLAKFGPAPSADYLKVINRDFVETRLKRPLDLARIEDRHLVDRIVEDNGIQLIILDSLLTVCSIDAQKDAAVWLPMQEWAYGHRGKGRAILYLHHASRAGNPFGTMMREVPLEAIIRLENDLRDDGNDDDGSTVKLSFSKHRGFYGADAAPMTVRFAERAGLLQWTAEQIRSTREQVGDLMQQGVKKAEIARRLGVSRGRITQIAKSVLVFNAYIAKR